MDTFTFLVLAIGGGGAALAARLRLLRNPWALMRLAKLNRHRLVTADDGRAGGCTESQVARLAAEHFGGSFERVTVSDLFPVLCSPEWQEALAVMLGCLRRHRRLPQGFQPSWDQYELLRAFWVPRPRRRIYSTPDTALDYLHLANTYGDLLVQAEDGAIERVPASWFRDYVRQQHGEADEAPVAVLVRALQAGDDAPDWPEQAANARRCITGRLKREGVLHPEFTDEVPELAPDRFVAALRTGSH